ncbi:MAG: hypothetical protein QXH41_06675 [Metallosphaera sp.]
MATIQDVEEVLSRHVMIRPPKNVIVVEDIVVDRIYKENGKTRAILVNGATPPWLEDVIIVTPTGTQETVLHELLHTYGLDEVGAYTFSPILFNLRKQFSIRRRQVHYELCTGCEQFKAVHTKYKNVAKHYVLS